MSTPLLGSCQTISVSVSQVRHMASSMRVSDMVTCLVASGIHLLSEFSFLAEDGRDGLLIQR